MNTQKVAITIPAELVTIIDDISKKRGISRSKYISTVLQEKVLSEKERQLRDAFNRVFSDDAIKVKPTSSDFTTSAPTHFLSLTTASIHCSTGCCPNHFERSLKHFYEAPRPLGRRTSILNSSTGAETIYLG
jgi:metal-responsive CopG/Arc/MetJ family transcriptional regulator